MTQKTFLRVFEIIKAQDYPAPVVGFSAHVGTDPYRVLFATILSLRTKDEVTLQASKRLFDLASNTLDLESLSVQEIQKAIYPVGFYKTKATQIKEIAHLINKNHNAKIPSDEQSLLAFKGVGKKTANLVLATSFNQDKICVDVHVHKIANRLGFINTKTPEQTELELSQKTPKKIHRQLNHVLVAFGQTICLSVSPKCSLCLVEQYCEKIGVKRSR